jgi:molybdopterin converting factor small subunit
VAKVTVEILGWLAAACGYNQSSSLPIEESVKEGSTVEELILQIARRDPVFRKAIFESDSKIQGYISFVLNGQILGQPVFLEARLKDGDKVMLLPAIDGG